MWPLLVAAGTGYLVGCWKKTPDLKPSVCARGSRTISTYGPNLQGRIISTPCPRQLCEKNPFIHAKTTGDMDLDASASLPCCNVLELHHQRRKSDKGIDSAPSMGTHISHGKNLFLSVEEASHTSVQKRLKQDISDMENAKLSRSGLWKAEKKRSKSFADFSSYGKACIDAPRSSIEMEHIEGNNSVTCLKAKSLFSSEEALRIPGDYLYKRKSLVPLSSHEWNCFRNDDSGLHKRSMYHELSGWYWDETQKVDAIDEKNIEDMKEGSLWTDGGLSRITPVGPSDAFFLGFLDNSRDPFGRYHLDCLHSESNRKRRSQFRRKSKRRKFSRGAGSLSKKMSGNSKSFYFSRKVEEDSNISRSAFSKPFVNTITKNRSHNKLQNTNFMHPIATRGSIHPTHPFPLSNDDCYSESFYPKKESLVKDDTKNHAKIGQNNKGESLFHFGVGMGAMFMLTVNRTETKKLQNSLKEAEEMIETLKEYNYTGNYEGRTYSTHSHYENYNEEEDGSPTHNIRGYKNPSTIHITDNNFYDHAHMDYLEAELEDEQEELMDDEESEEIQANKQGFNEIDEDNYEDYENCEMNMNMESNSGMMGNDLYSIDDEIYGDSYHHSPNEIQEDPEETGEEDTLQMYGNDDDCMPPEEHSCNSQLSDEEHEEGYNMHAEYDENFGVLPALLEKRLWEVLQQRQEEQISELEEALKISEETRVKKEKELWRWKDRMWWCSVSVFFIGSFVKG